MRNWKKVNATTYENYRVEYKKSFRNTWKKWLQQLIYSEKRRHLKVENLLALLTKQNYRCALSGVELTKTPGEKYTNVSIDRIDQSKGYALDNIRLVCMAANTMRWSMNDEYLYYWCTQILKERDKRNYG